jgi:hypothetical protein
MVTFGRTPNDALAPIEVAVASWSGGGVPTRDDLGRLHALRVAKRAVPVLLAVQLADARLLTFGPSPDGAPGGPFEVAQAARMLQAVLDEPDQIKARTRWAGFAAAVDSTSLAGVKNSGLFANHEIRVGVPQRRDWAEACRASSMLLGERQGRLIERLGFTVARGAAHSLVLRSGGPHARAVAVLLDDSESFDGSSARFAGSPVAYGLKQAENAEVPWVLLLRGGQLRLYPASTDLGVGRRGLSETYFEVDLPQLTADTAGYLTLVFSAAALADGGSAYQILDSSTQFAVGLGERLRDKVYDEIIPELSVAVAAELSGEGLELDAEGLDTAYQVTLRVFFRLLFQVYAEDRKLLPYGENPRYDRNALKTVAKDLTDDPTQPFDPESTTLWDDLAQVWRVIDRGDKAWGVPAYNGGLFATDDLHPLGQHIASITLTNDVMGPVLKHLLLDEGDDGRLAPIDFRALGVREFGTIYEGLLESSLGLAEVDLTLDDDEMWVPARKGDEVWAEAGDVYFHNTSGQRKGTGSYFTPSFVVEHLLETSLEPALDDHLAKIAALLENGDQAGAGELFFDFKVADLAMGSGHFLTAAIDHLERRMATFLAEDGHRIPGVAAELQRLGQGALEALGPDGEAPDEAALLRRQIARRCIYGLDINPIAVELARVSIWIHTFVRGLPMSSLDNNLVCANSLTGIGSIEEALDALVPGRNGAMTLFDGPIIDALENARKVLVDVANADEIDRKETQAAARAVAKARQQAATAKLLFDAAVLNRIGQASLVAGTDPESIAKLAARPEVQEVLAPLQPAHMPVLFPEVFLHRSGDSGSAAGGWDVAIGNPPWEEVMVEEPKFWLRISPGLLGLKPKDLKARIADLRRRHPEMLPALEAEVETAARFRKVLLGGPYPGLGTGDVDLYRAFAWRNWQLLRKGGRLGAVFPRNLLSAAGNAAWRAEVLEAGDVAVVGVINTNGWVFPAVHGQYSISLVSIVKGEASEVAHVGGPFHSLVDFEEGRTELGTIPVSLLKSASTGAAFPQLPSSESAAVFAAIRSAPRLDDPAAPWSFKPIAEFHATNDRSTFDAGGQTPSRWPVVGGAGFNIWEPETGEVYAWADARTTTAALQAKRINQVRLKKSAFFGMDSGWAADPATLPCRGPRLAFRDITNATNTRTCIAALVPPQTFLVNQAPYLLRVKGTEADEAYLLGVLCSIPLDWYARRYVELHLNFHILNGLPIPQTDEDDPLRQRVIEIAGRLASVDDRYATWARAVGVPVGSVKTTGERDDLEAELDAVVACLFGLDRGQVQHVFATFHRGWNYQPRLDAVLAHFDQIGYPR